MEGAASVWSCDCPSSGDCDCSQQGVDYRYMAGMGINLPLPTTPIPDEDQPWWRDILDAATRAGADILESIPSVPRYPVYSGSTPPFVEYPVPSVSDFRTTDYTLPIMAGLAVLFLLGRK